MILTGPKSFLVDLSYTLKTRTSGLQTDGFLTSTNLIEYTVPKRSRVSSNTSLNGKYFLNSSLFTPLFSSS